MALAHSPGIVTNGLTCYHDFGNKKKSFINEVLTNQYSVPTPDGSGNVSFPLNGTGTFQRIYTGTYGGYDIQPTDIVYKYVLGAAPTGCHYHGNDVTITAGVTATWSCDFYIDPSVTGYPVTNYLANFEGVVSGYAHDPDTSKTGVWKSFTFSSTAGSTGLCRMLLYPGACGSQLATGGFILYKNPQVTYTSYQAPAIGTLQSVTASQGLKDLTGNRTTNTLNITYPSGATPLTYSYLNSTSNAVATDSSSILDTDTHSIFFWIRFNTTSAYGSAGYSGGWDKIFTFAAGGSDRTPGIWRYPGNRLIHWRYDPSNTGTDISLNGTLSSNWGTDFIIDTWYYVGVTKNGGTATAYCNGANVGTNGVSSPKTSGSASVVYFEYYPTGLCSLGSCQIYNRVLSDAEVQQNFNALRGRYGI